MIVDNEETWNERQDSFEEEDVQREEARKNSNFVQLYRSEIKNLRTLMSKDANAAKLFLFLTEHMGKTNAIVCSYKVLEEAMNTSRSTVYRAVKTLKELNYLKVVKIGNANVYHLNSDVVWRSWNNGKKYAELSGKILIAESEQTEIEVEVESVDHTPILKVKEEKNI